MAEGSGILSTPAMAEGGAALPMLAMAEGAGSLAAHVKSCEVDTREVDRAARVVAPGAHLR